MDYAAYHVVYVDNRANDTINGKHIQKSLPASSDSPERGKRDAWEYRSSEYVELILPQHQEVRANIRSILSNFDGVHICKFGNTCMNKLAELESNPANDQPTLVILETTRERASEDDRTRELRHSSSHSLHVSKRQMAQADSVESENYYGLSLLQQIKAEISTTKLSKLVVPIAMISTSDYATNSFRQSLSSRSQNLSSGLHKTPGPTSSTHRESTNAGGSVDPQQMLHCLDAGAVDVFTSPLQRNHVYGLVTHGYRAHKEASTDRAALLSTNRLRKRSWVGFDDSRPYAYLREYMVSDLMTRICNPDHVLQVFDLRYLPGYQGLNRLVPQAYRDSRALPVPNHGRELELIKAVGSWGFCAHDFTDDELIHAAFLMLQHALALPELDNWRLPADELKTFLMASRAAYNSFVHYHNFRHVVDVLQAVFYFLVRMGTLPPYPTSAVLPAGNNHSSPIAALLRPFDALTLMISAIGHDVGHPGVNNAFLVALKAPLAQLYNDKSVLEAFHCAAYSQILRRYWKHAFEDISMRGLLISSILATDMGLHFKYMTDLGNLQDKVHHNNGTEGWSPQVLEEYRTLTCGLLIKCADISNVARPFDIAARWSDILQKEFANQGVMETDVGIPTTLFGGPPELGNIIKLANSQIGFMNIFAGPLFEAVTDVLPAMVFAVDEIKENQKVWKGKIEDERANGSSKRPEKKRSSDAFLSPRSGSPNRSASHPELSHPEGLPASQSSSFVPTLLSNSQTADTPRESRRGSAGSISHLLEVPESGSLQQPQDVSRRSSLGCSFGYGSPHDSTSFSRRSSGAFPGANILNPSLTRRRSSNSVPSQLHLGLDPESISQSSTSIAATENAQVLDGASDRTRSHSSLVGKSAPGGGFNLRDGDIFAIRGGEDINHDQGGKAGEPEQNNCPHLDHRTNRQANSNPAPLSANSSRNRSSSGAQTSLTQSMPYSPTGTLATSFLTVDSDEKSLHDGGEGRSSLSRTPAVVDVERPASAHSGFANSCSDRDMDNRRADVTVTNGGASSGHANGNKVLTRKGSRFRLDFWRKK